MGSVTAVDEDVERRMYEATIERLEAAGLAMYEISNFARPGQESRHNLVYWANDAYFGFGVGAARYLQGVRSVNTRDLPAYLRRIESGESATGPSEELSPEGRAHETAVLMLRRIQTGIDRDDFWPANRLRARCARRSGDRAVQGDGDSSKTMGIASGSAGKAFSSPTASCASCCDRAPSPRRGAATPSSKISASEVNALCNLKTTRARIRLTRSASAQLVARAASLMAAVWNKPRALGRRALVGIQETLDLSPGDKLHDLLGHELEHLVDRRGADVGGKCGRDGLGVGPTSG